MKDPSRLLPLKSRLSPGSPNGGMENTAQQLVWRSRYARRPRAEARRRWIGVYYGVVDGGRPNVRGSFFDEEIKFTGELDFAKLTGWEPLEGLRGFGEVRWRDGLNPNLRVGASPNFQPSHFQSGKQWRLMTFGLTYTTPDSSA